MTTRPVKDPTSPKWFALEGEEVLRSVGSGPEGLSTTDATERLNRHGPNRLPETPPDGPLRRFLRQFRNLLIYVLLAAAVVTAVLGHMVDTGVILAVVVVNSVIGFIQEGRAEQALSAIRDMLAPEAQVLRDGRRATVPAEELVPGDMVILDAGNRVPADLRLVTAKGLRVQEAVLTGESVPADKATDPVSPDAPIGDRRSMAYSGTLVATGTGRGIVVATGSSTEIGRISGLLTGVQTTTTPLLQQMEVFARRITGVILALAAIILAFGYGVAGMGFSEAFIAVVGLSVAAIPEGLPAILTVTLAIGVQAMARRSAIVRRLPAIEALGSISVICTDKTGTLTRNEMTVTTVATARQHFTVTGSGYSPHGDIMFDDRKVEPGTHPLLQDLALGAMLCNDAELRHTEAGWTVQGDPMEGALVTFACKAGLVAGDVRPANPQTDAIPFDAEHRFMATLHHDHHGNATIHVKGAPERILAMCTSQHEDEDGASPLNAGYWQRIASGIAAQGQRVLAIATKPAPQDAQTLSFDEVENGLTLLGLVGLIDPPREEAIAAVAECQSAGIQVKMITGDHGGTALAIARQLGLQNTDDVLEGAQIDGLDNTELQEQAARIDVFARTSPEHKLRLVEALQADGLVVAMTGDGVNDAPSLKRADIGIAMGKTGTEAAKEAAEIVLADDNFATIAAAIKAGRTVYDNLKKAVLFLLPVNGGEAMALIAALLLGLTLPITPVQILWVNMVSSVVLAMALAFEGAEPGIMHRPPRPASEAILSRFVIWRVVFVSMLLCTGIFWMFILARRQGASIEEARTIAVNTLVVMEIFYLFSVRFLNTTSLSFKAILGTRPVLIAITAVTALQFLFTYAPFMETFFNTRPLTISQGLAIIAVGPALLVILEIEKRILRYRQHQSCAPQRSLRQSKVKGRPSD
ncbi:cation-transporting P-type ATPase [Marinobacter sp. F3R11]|uniref:cation-transporting P-type ATPase n=1 Tax=Marinobacter sp. F3R11 TaxID=2267231 RepID=UPI000DEA006C|nr:cation-transporting P-type ATPase [Marinobacter sp. F3R11]RBW48442.1 cation-transporting P-type ATPase [Marinobacter sp. F3R11]